MRLLPEVVEFMQPDQRADPSEALSVVVGSDVEDVRLCMDGPATPTGGFARLNLRGHLALGWCP